MVSLVIVFELHLRDGEIYIKHVDQNVPHQLGAVDGAQDRGVELQDKVQEVDYYLGGDLG